jgi:DNA polymerase III delta subunit
VSLEKLHVLEGEPYRVRAALHRIVSRCGAKVRRFDRGENTPQDLAVMTGACTGFAFGQPTVVVVEKPTADQGNNLLGLLNKGLARCEAIVITFEGEYADGRQTWVGAANKAARVQTFDYVQDGDRQALLKYVMDWKKGTGARLGAQSAEWLVRNVPVLTASVKTDKGKRDSQVYDLGLMMSELDKLFSWAGSEKDITAEVLEEHASFSKTFDVWRFVDATLRQNTSEMLEQVRRMFEQVSSGPFGPLKILQGQLALAVSVHTLVRQGIVDSFEIQSRLDPSKFNARYWSKEDPQALDKLAAVNPFRIKKCIEAVAKKPDGHFADMLVSIDAAQIDLRRGVPQDLVMDRLVLSLSGHDIPPQRNAP